MRPLPDGSVLVRRTHLLIDPDLVSIRTGNCPATTADLSSHCIQAHFHFETTVGGCQGAAAFPTAVTQLANRTHVQQFDVALTHGRWVRLAQSTGYLCPILSAVCCPRGSTLPALLASALELRSSFPTLDAACSSAIAGASRLCQLHPLAHSYERGSWRTVILR